MAYTVKTKYTPSNITKKKKESEYFVPKTAEDWAYLAETFKLKKEPNIFQKTWGGIKKGVSTVFDVLQTPLYGVAGGVNALVKNFDDDVANDENPLNEIWKGLTWQEKDTYFQVLDSAGVKNKYVKGVLGTALNIFGDPVTYLTGQGILKQFNKINGKHLTEEGLKLFNQAKKQKSAIATLLKTSEFMDDPAKSLRFINGSKRIDAQLANVLKSDPDKYFKGIEWFGHEIVPRQFISGGLVGKAMRGGLDKATIAAKIKEGERLSKSQKFWATLDDAKTTLGGIVDDLFGKGKGVSGDIGFAMDNTMGAIRNTKNDIMDSIANIQKGVTKKFGKEAGEKAIKEGVEFELAVKNAYANRFGETISSSKEALKKLGIKLSTKKKWTPERVDKILSLAEKKGGDAPKLVKKILGARDEAMDYVNKLGFDIGDIKLSEEAKEYVEQMSGVAEILREASGLKKGLKYYVPNVNSEYLADMLKRGAGNNIRTKIIGQFNNAIKKENIVKNPMVAWDVKTGEVLKNTMASQTRKDLVDVYGFSVDKFKQLVKSKNPIIADLAPVEANGKILGYLNKADVKYIDGVLNPEFNIVDSVARTLGYDKFTSIFKRAVTSLFPAFHVRNALSGVVQNYEVLGSQAFNPANVFGDNLKILKAMTKNTDEVIQLGKNQYKLKDLATAFRNRFNDTGMYTFDNKDINNFVNGITGIAKRKMYLPEKAGYWTEIHQKSAAFTAALRKGNSIEDALKLAEQAGFDYRNLSKFESSIMKRLVPFYAFARKNAELQVKTLISTPARISAQKKVLDGFSEMMGGNLSENDVAGLPPWVQNALKIKVQDGKVVSGLDFPIQEFFGRVSDPVTSTLTSLNPIIKYPLEAETGYDFFRGKQIKNINTIDKPMYDLLQNPKTPKFLKDIFQPTSYEYKVKEGVKKGETITVYQANPSALHKLRTIPTSRIQGTLANIFGEGKTSDKLLAFFLGAKIYDIDVELQKHYQNRDMQEEIREYLMRIGGSHELNMLQVPLDEIRKQLQK
jgi:hypothetical protein